MKDAVYHVRSAHDVTFKVHVHMFYTRGCVKNTVYHVRSAHDVTFKVHVHMFYTRGCVKNTVYHVRSAHDVTFKVQGSYAHYHLHTRLCEECSVSLCTRCGVQSACTHAVHTM